MTTSADVRSTLARALALDLVGPRPGEPHERERLPGGDPPSRWYLTGYLVPGDAPDDFRLTPDPVEEPDDVTADAKADGDAGSPGDIRGPARSLLPSSMGLSVLVGSETTTIDVSVTWGDYRYVTPPSGTEGPGARDHWQREPRSSSLRLALPQSGLSDPLTLPSSGGLNVRAAVRAVVGTATHVGARAVSVFLVNERHGGATRREFEEATAFQVELALHSNYGFLARPNPRSGTDRDEQIADLLHRDQADYVTGHGVSGHADAADGACTTVRSVWIPAQHVPKIDVADVGGVELDMSRLAALDTPEAIRAALGAFGSAYGEWIAAQAGRVASEGLTGQRASVARLLLDRCQRARRRIDDGVEMLASDPVRRRAFNLMNRAMASTALRRRPNAPPLWRPFQLAFILMTVQGASDEDHADREAVDLLYFPTGGGKTEAYLGLAAFTILLRRLRDPSPASDGVTVIMRYTLRLLTIDQLERAAALGCALELLRMGAPTELGSTSFEVGLWVGGRTTPNFVWHSRREVDTAAKRTIEYDRDPQNAPRPIPLERCPWCFVPLTTGAYRVLGPSDHPTDFRVQCTSPSCEFARPGVWLPVNAVDETLYRRVPCFVIATVDKFASVPLRTGPATLFGRVVSRDADGVYPVLKRGAMRCEPLPPPSLIIQDELHLISGPLGTIAGVYEAAFEALWSTPKARPKIIASTATVRRADAQIAGLFGRTEVDVFPPPGPDRRDCFFARQNDDRDQQRLYVGVAAQGRSLKVVLLRTYLALFGAALREYERSRHAGVPAGQNPVDPYMTLVGYFNALRELGGSRRIVEDEVQTRLQSIAQRRRLDDVDTAFANRSLGDVIELTSRVTMPEVSVAKDRLGRRYGEDGFVNAALATNMISVGLDITRLGLMVVLGQPKTTAEYIQATSRVGRDATRPGLVVTLHNVHRPRDRSHYEQFEAYHAAFYRAVEATTVTPYAARALDRALSASVAAFIRHESTTGVPEPMAKDTARLRALETRVVDLFVRRPRAPLPPFEAAALAARLEARVRQVIDDWDTVVVAAGANEVSYFRENLLDAHPVLRTPEESLTEPAGAPKRRLKAAWSMREVEPSVTVVVPEGRQPFAVPRTRS
ncbi:MAG: helicase [Myxococcales bacterium]|nr:helicase [Myxococcales bacterium]